MFIVFCLSEGLTSEIRIPTCSCRGTIGTADAIAVHCVVLLIAVGKL